LTELHSTCTRFPRLPKTSVLSVAVLSLQSLMFTWFPLSCRTSDTEGSHERSTNRKTGPRAITEWRSGERSQLVAEQQPGVAGWQWPCAITHSRRNKKNKEASLPLDSDILVIILATRTSPLDISLACMRPCARDSRQQDVSSTRRNIRRASRFLRGRRCSTWHK
jgi:hypothetical protein